jgi:hypothetical protein
MKMFIVQALTIVLCGAATTAVAATEQMSATGYNVLTKQGEKITLPNGTVIMTGAQDHSSLVNDKTGEQTSEWCYFDSWLDNKGATKAFTGHCSHFYDNGDVLFVAVTGTTNDQPLTWTVIGGTGKFVGASGGGTTKYTSERSDGYAATYKATGTITTK